HKNNLRLWNAPDAKIVWPPRAVGILVCALAVSLAENHVCAFGQPTKGFVKRRSCILLGIAALFLWEVIERQIHVRRAVELRRADTEQALGLRSGRNPKIELNKANVGFIHEQLPARARTKSLRRRVIETRACNPAQDIELIARWDDRVHGFGG